MLVWCDDLGIDDLHETQVLFHSKYNPELPPMFSTVSRGDCAVAAMGPHAWAVFADYYQTIRDLMRIGC